MVRQILAILFSVLSLCNRVNAKNENLLEFPGFVFLHRIEPKILQSPRYFEEENFTGRKVLGYETADILVTMPTAQALKKVQRELQQHGYRLVVYDGYRPQRAVNFFLEWSKNVSDQQAKSRYYPAVNKSDIFKLGYLAEKSGHSRGSTVDVSLIVTNQPLHAVILSSKTLKDGTHITFLDDGTVDMGSSFDLFDEVSHHDSPLIPQTATDMRNFLRTVMKKHGFKDYPKEWWHYTLENEPYPNKYFDFVPLSQSRCLQLVLGNDNPILISIDIMARTKFNACECHRHVDDTFTLFFTTLGMTSQRFHSQRQPFKGLRISDTPIDDDSFPTATYSQSREHIS